MRFAERMNHITPSGIREFFDKGRRLPDAIDLSIGQAHFDVPEPIKAATIEAVRGACGRYSATQGYPDIIAATRAYLTAKYGLDPGLDLMMTAGAAGAITLGLLALVGPGDEVLVPDPYFVVYRTQVLLAGATPVYYDTAPDWRVRADAVAARLSPRTRVLILNSPCNPTGRAITPAEVAAVAALCAERGIVVLSDELYELFVYDAPHASILRHPEVPTLLVGGFSKSWGMPGWRLGYAAAPPALIDKMRTLQQFTYVCPPTLVQKGARAAFDCDMSPQIGAYRRKRDLVYEGLRAAGYEVEKPGGSFYIFPRVPWGTDLEFCAHALDHKLIVVPGRSFSRHECYFRLSFAADDATLARGLEVLARLAREP